MTEQLETALPVSPMSPAAAALQSAYEAAEGTPLPFDSLEPGLCFTVPLQLANIGSIRARASQKSKKEKRFVVVVHNDLDIVEVARIK